MVEGGVDVVEVGLPYSDPMMDGPVIQEAVDQALQGRRPHHATSCARSRRSPRSACPTLVMSYWNPIEKYGVERFADRPRGRRRLRRHHARPDPGRGGRLAGGGRQDRARPGVPGRPSSTDDRLKVVAAVGRGFIYAASTMGITGTRSEVGARAGELVGRLKAVTDTPIAVGLGVSNGAAGGRGRRLRRRRDRRLRVRPAAARRARPSGPA